MYKKITVRVRSQEIVRVRSHVIGLGLCPKPITCMPQGWGKGLLFPIFTM